MSLHTTYLGFDLPHPILPGACPLARDLGSIKELEDAGAPMIVLPSLFEEEVRGHKLVQALREDNESARFQRELLTLPEGERMLIHPEDYLDHLFRVKQLVDVPVVASLNGTTRGGWLRYAKLLEDAGADALELNLYDVETEVNLSAQEVERSHVEMVREITSAISIPVAVKLSPFYSSIPNIAGHFQEADAEAVVIFNRFYQPGLDLETMSLTRELELSTPDELNLRLRWAAILTSRVSIDVAVTGGVHSAEDCLKAIACGAQTCQVVSCLLKHGPGHIAKLVRGMQRWLEEHDTTLARLRGTMSLDKVHSHHALVRANYMHQLRGYSTQDSQLKGA